MESKKKVRFANVPPQTPSPSTSSTSLGSSPGPSTPPQLPNPRVSPMIVRPAELQYQPWQQPMPMPIPLPMAYPMVMPLVPSPPRHATRLTPEPEPEAAIDPLLAAPLHPSNLPPLHWDIAEHPDAVKLGSISAPGARELTHNDLASCAVCARGSPLRLRHMTLVFPGLPLTVEIEPDERPVWTARPLPYLTVGDVLYGLYRSLRLSVESRELDKLSRELRESMRRAFDRRIMRDRATRRDSVDRNLHHGIRRIDYLGERRQLVGLRPAVGAEVPPGKRRGEVFVVKLAPAQ